MSFGVSASDIITVISFGFTVYERIRECPIEQKELACQIVDFRQLLDVIDIDLHSPRFVQGIEQQRLKCYRLLQRLDEDTSKYTKGYHPNEKLSGRRRRVLKEAKWVVYQRDRFKKSQEELRSQIYHLYFLLQNSSTSIYHEISMTLDRVENGTSVATEQWPDLKPIRFIDALDRRREFPFELCEEWEDFQELVKRSFKGSFGRSWVEAGRYEITDEATGVVITADEWNIKIKPGMLISMAMLVEKPSISTKTEIYCPSCDTTYEI